MASDDTNDFTEHYNTELDPASESSFQDWMKGQSDATGRDVSKDLYDYDMRGYWQQHLHENADEPPQLGDGHLTDEFKKPNHPTFSTGSKYHDMAGNEGGTWEELPGGESGVHAWTFKPGATNLQHHEPGQLKSYFDKVEPGNQLVVPEPPHDFGSPGQIDRSRIRSELEQKPALAARLNQMIKGEVGARASPEVRRIQMETAMNRALARGHSLEQALWDTSMAGNRGYYPQMSFGRGTFDEATFKGDLDAVLGGSNYAGKYGKGLITGNASADVARHQFQKGTPGFTVETGSGPESYFSEGPFRVAMPNNFPEVNARITDPAGLPNSTVHNLSEKEKDALNLRTAEYKGKATPEELDKWQTLGGKTPQQIEENLKRGPAMVPKDSPGVDKFLKDNPDIEYKDDGEFWLIQPPKTQPAVAQSKARIAAFGDYLRQVADLGGKIHVGELSSAAQPSKNIENRTRPDENPDAEYARLAASARVRRSTKR